MVRPRDPSDSRCFRRPVRWWGRRFSSPGTAAASLGRRTLRPTQQRRAGRVLVGSTRHGQAAVRGRRTLQSQRWADHGSAAQRAGCVGAGDEKERNSGRSVARRDKTKPNSPVRISSALHCPWRQVWPGGGCRGEIRLVVLDSATGRLQWSQQLAHVDQGTILFDSLRRMSGGSPSFAEGVLVCPTSAGAIVAVDLANRSLLGVPLPRGRQKCAIQQLATAGDVQS